MDDDVPRMKTLKKMYEDMTNAPEKMSLGHTTQKMDVASKMFQVPKAKKMAKGGVTRADGCITKGHTRGKMV